MVTMSGSISAKMRTPLEPTLYRLAMDHASHIRDPDADDLDHSLQATILSVACLEAFINWVGMSAFGNEWDDYEAGKSQNRKRHRPTLEDKWVEVTRKHTSGQTFVRGRQPFQGFKRLVSLRDYILHYKAGFIEPVPTPKGNVTEARAHIDHQSAQRATDVMKLMLLEFHRLSNVQAPAWIT